MSQGPNSPSAREQRLNEAIAEYLNIECSLQFFPSGGLRYACRTDADGPRNPPRKRSPITTTNTSTNPPSMTNEPACLFRHLASEAA
jgi:hypothetical protein